MLPCDNGYDEGDFKVADHCPVTGKHREAAPREVKFNHKTPVVFHKLKNYDSHLIMPELGKFNIKINVIPNGLEIHELWH